jgi:hypothetical protein
LPQENLPQNATVLLLHGHPVAPGTFLEFTDQPFFDVADDQLRHGLPVIAINACTPVPAA